MDAQTTRNAASNEHTLRSSSDRPQVLFIVDVPNWSHDFKTDNLTRTLGNDYCIQKVYQDQVSAADLDQSDLILVYYWLQFERMLDLTAAFERNRHKLLLGVCSQFELEGSRGDLGMTILRQWAQPVFTINRQIFRFCQSHLNVPVVYTPNGVDTTFYQPVRDKQPNSVMRVGWAGSLTNQGPVQRGYHDFILPAAGSIPGVELVTAAREDKWRGPEEMREFYRSLDVYICASKTEGTPNPCLEAAACGVPLLTTRVGNMPELVLHGVNGFFIEQDVEDLAGKLCMLRDDLPLRTSLGRRILQDIQEWDWSKRSQAYRQMFDETLLEQKPFNSAGMRSSADPQARITNSSAVSVSKTASEGINVDHIRAAILKKAKQNLGLIPDSFLEQHKKLEMTIIMLSYGRFEMTVNALRAVKESVLIPFRLLLIDNGSGDDVQAKLKEICSRYPFIDLVLLDENLGCVGGRVHALNLVNTEYVMFLDNDVEVFPGTVEHLLYSLEQHPEAVGSSCKIVLPNGLVHLCGADYWLEDEVLFYELYGDGKHFDDPLIGPSRACKWISGGATLIRGNILRESTLDSSMRHYYEDLEWCYRLNKMGIGCFYRSVEALALHYHEPVSSDGFSSVREKRRNSMKYIETIASFYKRHGTIIQNLFDFAPDLGSPRNPVSVSAARIFLDLVNSRGGDWVLGEWNHERLAPLFDAHALAAREAKKEHTIMALEAQIAEKDRAVLALSAEAGENQRAAQALSTEVAEKERALQALSADIADNQRAVQALSAVVAEKERAVRALSAEVAQKEAVFQAMSVEITDNQKARQTLAAVLAEKDTELNRITSTLGWRILKLYGRIKYPYLLPVYRLVNRLRGVPATKNKAQRGS